MDKPNCKAGAKEGIDRVPGRDERAISRHVEGFIDCFKKEHICDNLVRIIYFI